MNHNKKTVVFFSVIIVMAVAAFLYVDSLKKWRIVSVPDPYRIGSAKLVQSDTSEELTKADLYIKYLTGLLLVSSAGLAALTYFRNGTLERAKWLSQLHEKFFEKETYQDIRIILDYKGTEYDKLKEILSRDSNSEPILQEKLIVYLNFFEYVSTLWEAKQISVKEAHMLFGYYLKNLKKHDWLMSFLKNNDFKNLDKLITAITALDLKK
jgi:hypothetical protein